MGVQYKKAEPTTLRKVDHDERWLQDRINEDPSILGLGDLNVIERERTQASGGRIDFLMYEPESGVRYEVEVMLGALDESHIIRTIEYWDIERRRFPSLEHRAVIVAEDITTRFLNVISLLNNSIPLIAIQLNAFRVDSSLVLHFTKVLDITESADEEEQGTVEQVDRQYWERRAHEKSLELLDHIINLVPPDPDSAQVIYNRSHVAIRTTGVAFCWCHPRKSGYLFVIMRFREEERENALQILEDRGISAELSHRRRVKFKLTPKEIQEEEEVLREVIGMAELHSREK